MSPEIYQKVKQDIMPYLMTANLSGAGEPFLAPHFPEMVEDTIRYDIHIEITTNCMVYEESLLKKLLSAKSTLIASVDGSTEEVTNRMRPGIDWNKLIGFLEQVHQLDRQINNPDFSFRFNMVLTRSNLQQIGEVLDMADKFGVKAVMLSSFLTGFRTDSFVQESLYEAPEAVEPYLRSAREKARKYGISLEEPAFRHPEAPREDRHKYTSNGRLKQCPHPWWSTYIEANGTVLACCIWWPPLGNLNEQSFRQIWNNAQYRQLRKTVNTPDMPPACQQCSMNVRI